MANARRNNEVDHLGAAEGRTYGFFFLVVFLCISAEFSKLSNLMKSIKFKLPPSEIALLLQPERIMFDSIWAQQFPDYKPIPVSVSQNEVRTSFIDCLSWPGRPTYLLHEGSYRTIYLLSNRDARTNKQHLPQ